MKTPVVYNQNYTIYLENFQGYTFIHCDCVKWNKSVRSSLIKNVDTLVKLHGTAVFALHDPEDLKHLKFLTMLNFEFNTTYPCNDGKVRQIFTRSK